MSHSPGPWKFDHDWRRIPSILDDDGIRVASVEKDFVSGGWVKDLPQREANAELIAAAPDMKAALMNVQKIISEAAATGFNCKEGDWAERLFASQQATSAALKKATGKHNGSN